MKIAALPRCCSPPIRAVEKGPPTPPSRHDLRAESLENSKHDNSSVLSNARRLVEYGAKVSCMVLLVVDVVGNNWDLNDFAGNARHFLTPLLSTRTVAQLQSHFAFPTSENTSQTSLVGQFMIDRVLAQVHDTSGAYYRLTMGSHRSTNPVNDICGSLVRTYAHPSINHSSTCTTLRLGVVHDHVTFIRGNSMTHVFGSSAATDTRGRAGDNAATLASLGYVPGRVGLDMRLTTAVSIPAPLQQATANVTMYRFFAKALCSGCRPGTELGMDVCSIVYSYNDRTNQVVVTSSSAVPGRAYALGMVSARRWGPILSQWLRGVGLVAALTGFAATQKTVQWVDKMSASRFQRLVWLVAPPVRCLASTSWDFMSFCLNSDVIVLVFSISVAMDEDVSTVYAGELRRWSDSSEWNGWTQMRLWALDLRWIWFNLVILKALKCACHVFSLSRHSGTNVAMGWLSFRSAAWVFFTLGAVFARASLTEYGNSVRVDVASPGNDLDSIFVEFEQSWYIRALPSLIVLMVANVVIVVAVDHVLNRRWWRAVAKNSLCRQLIFNSTSIVADIHLTELHHDGAYVVAAIPARKLSTVRWYLGSHLTCFGLKEVPGVLKTSVGIPNTSRTGRRPSNAAGIAPVAKSDSAVLFNVHFVVQDPNGYIHVCDSKAIEMQAARADASAVENTQLLIG